MGSCSACSVEERGDHSAEGTVSLDQEMLLSLATACWEEMADLLEHSEDQEEGTQQGQEILRGSSDKTAVAGSELIDLPGGNGGIPPLPNGKGGIPGGKFMAPPGGAGKPGGKPGGGPPRAACACSIGLFALCPASLYEDVIESMTD